MFQLSAVCWIPGLPEAVYSLLTQPAVLCNPMR